jgi:hypothetical protein
MTWFSILRLSTGRRGERALLHLPSHDLPVSGIPEASGKYLSGGGKAQRFNRLAGDPGRLRKNWPSNVEILMSLIRLMRNRLKARRTELSGQSS